MTAQCVRQQPVEDHDSLMGSNIPPTRVSWAPRRMALGSKLDTSKLAMSILSMAGSLSRQSDEQCSGLTRARSKRLSAHVRSGSTSASTLCCANACEPVEQMTNMELLLLCMGRQHPRRHRCRCHAALSRTRGMRAVLYVYPHCPLSLIRRARWYCGVAHVRETWGWRRHGLTGLRLDTVPVAMAVARTLPPPARDGQG